MRFENKSADVTLHDTWHCKSDYISRIWEFEIKNTYPLELLQLHWMLDS